MVSSRVGFVAVVACCLSSSAALASPKPIIEELFKANQTLGGRVVKYSKGQPEMRVDKITLNPGAKIPLHTLHHRSLSTSRQEHSPTWELLMVLKSQTQSKQVMVFWRVHRMNHTMSSTKGPNQRSHWSHLPLLKGCRIWSRSNNSQAEFAPYSAWECSKCQDRSLHKTRRTINLKHWSQKTQHRRRTTSRTDNEIKSDHCQIFAPYFLPLHRRTDHFRL